MDKVFKAIGRFFKKIWEWIKSTAWVQPLLIVAIIFGIIFSINPIVNGIKGLVDQDTTGEFYKKNEVQFRDLFLSDVINNQEKNYSTKNLLNDNSGKVMVLYVKDNTMESDVITFMNSARGQNCKLYVVNMQYEENQRSKLDTTGSWTFKYHYYQYDNAADYYDYLLDSFVAAYDDLGVNEDGTKSNTWRNSYAPKFEAKYGYSAFYSGFDKDDTYTQTSTSATDAYQDIHLPAAVVYNNGAIQDMRFASSDSFTNYGNTTKSVTNYEVLADLWEGVE